MAQVSYGTITITDTNDIESITMEYAQSTSNSTAPTSGWSGNIPTWEQGKYIWQRTRIHKSGTASSADEIGDPVCLTGSTGATGTTGRGVSSIVTSYCNYGTGTPAASYSGWDSTVPAYDNSKPNYWVKVVITYTSGSPATDTSIYKDNGITDATATAASANTVAAQANQTANTAASNASNALSIATGINQHFWTIATDYATGVPAGSYITDTEIDTFKSQKTGGNLLTRSDGIYIRNGTTTLSSLTSSALTFNNPSNGSKVIELSSISNVPTLSFYNPSNNTIPMMRLSTNALTFGKPSDGQVQLTIGANGALQSGDFSITADTSTFASLGTKIDLTYGEIYTPYFRVSQGSISGGPAAGVYITGHFGSTKASIGDTKPWIIKTFTDSKQISLASITGPNSSFIQLGSSGSWLLHSNKIHTAWYISGNYLEYPLLNEKYYDFGMNLPTSLSDKFLYIRYNTGTNLSSIYQNDTNWVYPFYIDASGNVHAPAYYVGSEPLTGGVGSIAEKIINSDSTYGKGSATQPVYIDSNGRPAITTYALNAAGAKGVVTDLANNTTSTNLPTAAAVVSYVTSRGYITSFTDKNVQTNLASNSSTFYIAGPTSTATTTGTLKVITDAKVTVDGNGKATITATNFSGTASRATADSDGNTIKTTYLKLSGGTVTGAVTFGSSVSVDELTVGDLVVNGNASFTNNAQFNTINGVAVGSSPKFTDNNTTYTFANGTNGFTVTPSGGTAQTVTVTPSITNNVTGSGTSGYLAKFTGGNTIGNGPALGTDTTKFLNNKGEWAVPAGTYTYTLPLAASGVRGGVQIGYTQSGKNYPVQLSSEKMYVNVPWENTWTAMTGATSSADGAVGYVGATPPKSGYNTKYWRADGTWSVPPNDNTHRPIQLDSTEILGNNTTALNLVTGGGMALSNSSGSVTIAHKDTSSQATSTNSGRTYIQSITLDTYGHVTGLSTATESVTDTHYTTHLYAGKSDGNVNAATTNGNTYLMVLDNTTVRDRRKISGSGAASVTSDANGNITINSPVAITGVSFADGTITFTKSDGNTIPITTDNFVITQASGATALVRLKANSTTEYEGYSAGGATTAPVYFDSNGHPAAVTSIPWSLIASKPSSYTPSSHTHGNITNGGDITTTATIASGDRLVINDESESKINNSSITFGTSTTTFLSNKGTWETPSAAGSATNATYATYDASEASNTTKVAIADKYIPKSIGTAAGDIIYWSASGTPTRLAKGSNGQVLKLANGVPTWGTDNNDNTWRAIQVNGTDILGTGTNTGKLNLKAGSNVTITNDSGTVTIASSYTNTDTKMTQAYSTTNNSYPLLMTATADVSSTSSRGATTAILNNAIYANPSTGMITAFGLTAKKVNNFITGSGTAASDKGSGVSPRYFPAKWTFNIGSTLTDGDIITIKVPVAGHSYGVYLSIDNGTTYKPIVLNGTGRLTTHYGVNTYITLIYEASGSAADMYALNGADARATVTGGAWRVINYYDSNSNTIPQAQCETAAGTAAKTASMTYYTATANRYVMVNIRYANTSQTALTLNINSTGAKPIYINGSASSTSNYTLPAGSYLVFYNGTNYYFRTDNIITGNITGNAATATKLASAQTVYVTLGTASTTTTIQGGSSSAQTIGVNGTLAIGNGGTGLTASPSMLTNLGSTTAANVLQASPRPGVTGTLGVGNGGTGQTSAKNAANAFLNALDTGSSTPVDADYYISQYVNGGTTTTTYHRRPMSALWNYISGKISSSGTYVTIATDQTITANQKTFNGAIRWGTASKYGAAHYDSTLEAIVFSFA